MKSTGKRFGAIGAILIIAASLGSSVLAGEEEPMTAKSQSGVPLDDVVDWDMCRPDGIAVGGYDLISYRQPDGPVAGNEDFSAEYAGVTYLFASDSNRKQFIEDPQRYIPTYNGFCAVTLALGRVTCPDFTNFQIEDDRLLLFEVTGFTNGRTLWNSDAPAFRQQADTNFGRLLGSR